MQLIMSPASPFVRKVRVTVRELGLERRVEEVNVATTPLKSDPQALAGNPTGKIPSLIRPDGPALHDSRVICRYLDHIAKGGLYPESRVWEVLTLESLGLAIADAAVSMIYEERFKGTEGASGDWIAAQWGKVEGGLAAVERDWLSHLEGKLTAAQITLGCALAYLDFRMPQRDWRGAAPNVAEWFEEFAKRPSMVSTKPE